MISAASISCQPFFSVDEIGRIILLILHTGEKETVKEKLKEKKCDRSPATTQAKE
jgi:hypothetical protein